MSAIAFGGAFLSFAFAQQPVFSGAVDSSREAGLLGPSTGPFNFVRVAGKAPFDGSVAVATSPFGQGKAVMLRSAGYGSMPNLTGVGANGLRPSRVYSLSIDITSDLWQSGSSTLLMLGQWTEGSAQQVYNPGQTITTKGITWETVGAQSLFALVIGGSKALNGGYLQSVLTDGKRQNIRKDGKDVVLLNGAKYRLHLIANGGGTPVAVGDLSIPSMQMAVYLDGHFVALAPIASSTPAGAMRLMAVGNSVGNLQTTLFFADLTLWDTAVGPSAR